MLNVRTYESKTGVFDFGKTDGETVEELEAYLGGPRRSRQVKNAIVAITKPEEYLTARNSAEQEAIHLSAKDIQTETRAWQALGYPYKEALVRGREFGEMTKKYRLALIAADYPEDIAGVAVARQSEKTRSRNGGLKPF
jgi:hypothetical protein